MPEQPSHSLGKLVRALGIPMADRHRASGDAMATVKLFKMLLEKDLNKEIVKELIKTEIKRNCSQIDGHCRKITFKNRYLLHS